MTPACGSRIARLTRERLMEVLSYDEDSGVMTWKTPTSARVKVGDRAGKKIYQGYRRVAIDGHEYMVHRLVWLWHYGELPYLALDHIDGNTDNNRISNLRLATKSQNAANSKRPSTNTSGFKGVVYDKATGLWTAKIQRTVHLGRFSTPEEAHRAYVEGAQRFFREYARAE